jgi:hypothetical protein
MKAHDDPNCGCGECVGYLTAQDDMRKATPPDLEAIRARNEERVPRHHHEDGDPFYSCPQHPESLSIHGPDCLCDFAEQVQTKADINALLAEVERLRAWMTFVQAYAHRTMPHAMGQGHVALMGVESFAIQAKRGDPVPLR